MTTSLRFKDRAKICLLTHHKPKIHLNRISYVPLFQFVGDDTRQTPIIKIQNGLEWTLITISWNKQHQFTTSYPSKSSNQVQDRRWKYWLNCIARTRGIRTVQSCGNLRSLWRVWREAIAKKTIVQTVPGNDDEQRCTSSLSWPSR